MAALATYIISVGEEVTLEFHIHDNDTAIDHVTELASLWEKRTETWGKLFAGRKKYPLMLLRRERDRSFEHVITCTVNLSGPGDYN